MRAFHFTVTSRTSGVLLGHALLCPDARYASVRWPRAPHLDRRHTDAAGWRTILADLEIGWPKGRVDGQSMLASVLIQRDVRGSVLLTLASEPPITITDPVTVTDQLDAYLWAQVL